MRDLVVLFLHLISTVLRLAGPGGGCFRNQLLVASPYLTQEKALMPDLEWTRTVEAKKLFLNIANQELAVISPTIDCGRTVSTTTAG